MSDTPNPLYTLLLTIKPENLTLNAWAARAKVSRSWFNDIKKGTAPNTVTLEKVVLEAGFNLAQFFDLLESMLQPVDRPLKGGARAPLAFPRRSDAMDLPLLGTAQASDMEIAENGSIVLIERMDLDAEHIVDYVRRPPSLATRRDVYALTVTGTSLFPRYKEGAVIYVDPRRQASADDDVVVQLVREGEDGEQRLHLALLKTLVRRTSRHLELEQYNPPLRFSVPAERVLAVHRVIPWNEIVFF